MNGRSSRQWPWLTMILVVGVALLGWLAWRATTPGSGPEKTAVAGAEKRPAGKAIARSTPSLPIANTSRPGFAAAATLLNGAWAQLPAAPPEERAAVLARLGEKLDALQTEDAFAALLAELASGRDAKTELPFAPGEEGLASASSWRVFLLDRLGRLDPRLTADYARQSIFPSSRSAEEWAVSMRSVWHSYPPRAVDQARAEVTSLLGQMLARPEWRAGQAEGLLEALDFVPHTADPTVHLEAMGAWINESRNPATATAAQIALERTMGPHGDVILTALAASPAEPSLRAPAMARADLRRPAQAQAVADFLRGQPAGSEEAAIFFRAFPLHRFSVAPGLAGLPRVPDAAQLKAADEAALPVVADWSADPALANHRADLTALLEKLRELTGQK